MQDLTRFLPVSVFKIFPLKIIHKNIQDLTFYTAMIMQDQSYLVISCKQWLNLEGSCNLEDNFYLGTASNPSTKVVSTTFDDETAPNSTFHGETIVVTFIIKKEKLIKQ